MAILTLLNAESCGLDSSEQVYVNHWKLTLDEEVKKMYYGLTAEFKDTNWIDTSLYMIPTSGQVTLGNFGSHIMSPNTVEFFDCNLTRSQIKTGKESGEILFSVYPNPNQGVFNVLYTLPEKSSGEIIVWTIEGKEIYRLNCKEGEHRQGIDLTGTAAGSYIYSYIVDGTKVKQGKFIIQ